MKNALTILRPLTRTGQTVHTKPAPRTTIPDGPPGKLRFLGQTTPTSSELVRHPTQPTMAVSSAPTSLVSRSMPGVPVFLIVNLQNRCPTPGRHPSLTRPTRRTLILATTPTAPSRPLAKPCRLKKNGQKLRRRQLPKHPTGSIPGRTRPTTRLRPWRTLLSLHGRKLPFAPRPTHLSNEKLWRPQSPMTLPSLGPLLPKCTMSELANITPNLGHKLQYPWSLPS